jgi:hypothetical protein
LKTWKDLPSENWAEMMEFWHCHKPHDHDAKDEDSLGKKGYGASSAIAAQPSVGLVDQTSFLVSEVDCTGLLVSLIAAQSHRLFSYVLASVTCWRKRSWLGFSQ